MVPGSRAGRGVQALLLARSAFFLSSARAKCGILPHFFFSLPHGTIDIVAFGARKNLLSASEDEFYFIRVGRGHLSAPKGN